MILLTQITTNVVPYLIVLIDYLTNRCCRKRRRSLRQFQFERKYAQTLNTVFVCFTFGFAVPLLFIWCLIPIALYAIIDRILLVYWYKPVPQHDDIATRLFLKTLKYAPVLTLFFTGLIITYNQNMVSNNVYSFFPYDKIEAQKAAKPLGNFLPSVIVFFCFGGLLLMILITYDIFYIRFWAQFARANKGDLQFAPQLSELQRKQWLAEENYRQVEFGISTISDEFKEILRTAKCKPRICAHLETFNYDILLNPSFSFGLGLSDCRQRYYSLQDRQITDVMMGSYSPDFDEIAQKHAP